LRIILNKGNQFLNSSSVWALGSTVVVSLLSLIGVVTTLTDTARLKSATYLLVGLATGALFGDAIIHLLPQAFEASQNKAQTSLLVLCGVFGFFILEKFLHWRHKHSIDDDDVTTIHPMGRMNLIADGLHNSIDGLLIGASYLVDVQIGIATTVAVLLHELPQELGDFGVLIHAGYSRSKALLFNLVSASFAIAAVLIALWIGTSVADFTQIMIPIAAGAFLYVAGSDLVPELHKERAPQKSLAQFISILVGCGLMWALLFIE
jgi:zinc and cadmium transporter